MSSPTVLVEIAFNAGYSTPAASRTWTDITAYVLEGSKINITYGRQDELGVCDANQLSLTLNNSDGRFTWGNASSPYYPNVLIGRPIRVTVGGSVRFTGYVNEWPVEWPGGVTTFATASITASSRLSRLGLNSPLKSVVEEAILAPDPLVYYTLGDEAGSARAVDYTGALPALVQFTTGADVVFGNEGGPTTDNGMTSALFAAGRYLKSEDAFAELVAPTELAISAFFAVTTDGSIVEANELLLEVVSGRIQGVWQPDSMLAVQTSATTYADGALHHGAVRYSSSGGTDTLYLYVDGVLIGSTARPTTAGSEDQVVVGNGSTTGIIAHVSVYDSVVTGTQVAEIAAAGLDGFAGDTADERLDRYAAWANIPAAEVISSTGPITLDHIDSTGVQVVEMMRKVETAEAGVLHDNRDGNLELEPRSARYGTTVAVTLDASSGQVGMDYRPNVDRSNLYTIGQGSNLDGTVTARYTNETARANYGDTTYTVETAAQDDSEPLQRVAWVVNANSTPRPRAPQATVNMMPYVTAGTTAPLVALDIGSKVRISNAPSQAPATTTDYFVEGYSETVGASVWSLTLNLSPVDPYDDVLILDSATVGLLDTNILAL